jgi:hypothetical protein
MRCRILRVLQINACNQQQRTCGKGPGRSRARPFQPDLNSSFRKFLASPLSPDDEGLTLRDSACDCDAPVWLYFFHSFQFSVASGRLHTFHSSFVPPPLRRTTTRHVAPVATGVSFFFSNESVVDTPRLFGVKSASSLVVGGTCEWLPCVYISVACLFLFPKIEFALFYPCSGALSLIDRNCRPAATWDVLRGPTPRLFSQP